MSERSSRRDPTKVSSRTADKSRKTKTSTATENEKDKYMLVLPELADRVRRERRHENNDNWRYSSKRNSRRDRIRRSSKGSSKGHSSGGSTESTSRSITSSERSNPVMDQLQEKLSRMQAPPATGSSSHSRRSGHRSSSHSRSSTHSRRSPHRRSGSSQHSSSSRSPPSRLSTSERSSSRETSPRRSRDSSEGLEWSPHHSSRRSRSRNSRSNGDNNSKKRYSHRRSRSSSLEEGSNSDDASLDIDALMVPGALRVDSIGQISALSMRSLSDSSTGSHNGDPVVVEENSDHTEDSESIVSSSRRTLRSTLGIISENQPMIEATVAQNYEDELEEARAQGRQEALRRTNGSAMAVVFATNDRRSRSGSHDDFDDDDEESTVDGKRKRTVLCYAAMLCCLILAIGLVGSLMLLGGDSDNSPNALDEVEFDDESNLKAVILYHPPTQEECQAIVDGTMLEGQVQSLIQKSFDIEIDITLASEADFGALLSALIGHLQQKLIPIMAGCQAINLFDATNAISDKLSGTSTTNVTATNTTNNAITNGQVQERDQRSCDAAPVNSDESCRVFMLVLDLYLEEEESNVFLLEVIGETIVGEEIANTLAAVYPVQTASVGLIAPAAVDPIVGNGNSTNNNDITPVPTDVGETTPQPTQSQIQDSTPSPPVVTPPTLDGSTSVPVRPPTSSPSKPLVPTNSGQVSPTLPPTKATSSPSRAPNSTPVNVPTAAPTRKPTPSPASSPTKSPTARPVSAPTEAPTRTPTSALDASPPTAKATSAPNKTPTAPPVQAPAGTPVPTDEPSLRPSMETAMPSQRPSRAPVVGPTTSPSRSPTQVPSKSPTASPSKSPTTSPTKSPTTSPSKSPTTSPTSSPTTSPTKSPTANPTSSPTTSPTKSPTANPTSSPTDAPSRNPTKQPTPTGSPTKAPTPLPTGTPTIASEDAFCCSKDFQTCGGVNAECQASQEACGACNNAAWIQEGTCTTGLGRNDECTDDPTGCCAGSCITVGTKLRCRII